MRFRNPQSTHRLPKSHETNAALQVFICVALGQDGLGASRLEGATCCVPHTRSASPDPGPPNLSPTPRRLRSPAPQRTFEIWSFAIQFAWRYALLNQKFTYGKEGMTKDAVSARKKELAIWLREGLVRLGPT
jgi:hypothetical protein